MQRLLDLVNFLFLFFALQILVVVTIMKARFYLFGTLHFLRPATTIRGQQYQVRQQGKMFQRNPYVTIGNMMHAMITWVLRVGTSALQKSPTSNHEGKS